MKNRGLGDLARYITNPFRETARESRSIRDEVVFHLTESARSLMNDGCTADQACDDALRCFGDPDVALRKCNQIASQSYLRMHRIHLAVTSILLAAIVSLALLVFNGGGGRLVGDGDLTGRVVDEQSRPIENAHVLAVVKTWPQQAFRQQPYATTTRSDGSFEIRGVYPTKEEYAVQISVVAEGWVLKSQYVGLRDGRLEPLDFTLPRTDPLTVRFASADGRPIEGVEVFPFERCNSAGERHTVYFCSAAPIVRSSDAYGAVPLPYYLPGDSGSLYVRQPGGTWSTQPITASARARELAITLPSPPTTLGETQFTSSRSSME